MRMPTSDEVNALLRHVYSSTATAISVLVLVGLSQGDATALGNAIHQIGDGIAKIVAGVAALIPIASGIYAAYTASPFARLLRAKANPEIAQVLVVPGTKTAALADSIPGDKITVAK